MAKIGMIGLDLAKNVFQGHGVGASGAVVLRHQLRRGQVKKFFAQQAPTLVGMRRAPARNMGAGDRRAGSPGSCGAAVLCESLREAEQEGRARRGGNLRGDEPPLDAVCGGDRVSRHRQGKSVH